MKIEHHNYDMLEHVSSEKEILSAEKVHLFTVVLVDVRNLKISVRYSLLDNGIKATTTFDVFGHSFTTEEETLTVGKCTECERAWPIAKISSKICLTDNNMIGCDATACAKVPFVGDWHCISLSDIKKPLRETL